MKTQPSEGAREAADELPGARGGAVPTHRRKGRRSAPIWARLTPHTGKTREKGGAGSARGICVPAPT